MLRSDRSRRRIPGRWSLLQLIVLVSFLLLGGTWGEEEVPSSSGDSADDIMATEIMEEVVNTISTPVVSESSTEPAAEAAAEPTAEPAAEPADTVEVQDYLETLSQGQLEQICKERGFAIDEKEPLQFSDYVEAARQCLSMEDSINAILAENPELAAELEVEIDRMKDEKHRLETERQELLAQVASLQAQLENAGQDASEFNHLLQENHKAANMTFPELFTESMVELYHRVRSDFVVVGKLLAPIFKSAKGALKLLWRYADPLVGDYMRTIALRANLLWQRAGLDKFCQTILEKAPVIGNVYKVVVKEVQKVVEMLIQTEPNDTTSDEESPTITTHTEATGWVQS
jgi:hypothetical protein